MAGKMVIKIRKLSLVAFIMLAGIVFIGTASAATLTVDDSGGADYTRIQDAVNNGNAGDTILVYSGTYYENINVNKQLILTGVDNGGGKPVINGSGSGDVVVLNASGITFSRFVVQSGNVGITVSSSNNIIKDNIMQGNHGLSSRDGKGINIASGSANNTFTNNTVQNNNGGISSGNWVPGGNGYGFYLASSNNNTFTNNTVQDNNGGKIHWGVPGSNGYGFYLASSNNNTFTNNTVQNNNGSEGVDFEAGGHGYGFYLSSNSNDNTFTNNIIQGNTGGGRNQRSTGSAGNGYGIYLTSSNNNIFTNNTVQNNNGGFSGHWEVVGGNGYGIYLTNSNNNVFTNNTVQNNDGGSTSIRRQPNGGTGYGIYLTSSNNNTFTNNTVQNNNGGLSGGRSDGPGWLRSDGYGLYMDGYFNGNIIYNNHFNNTINISTSTSASTWNTTKTAAQNIVGGPYLGGNFWANPSGTGFSQTCTDADWDGICDSPYTLDASNIDYLPLSMNFISDATPPTTTIALSGTLGNNGWYISDVLATLNATDNEGGSGVKITEYSFDGTNWIQYNVPFTITDEGTTTVYYKSKDNAGNVESTSNQTIKIDKTPPTITGAPTTSPNTNGWYNTDVVIHFNASDTVSGIDTVTPDTTISTEGVDQSVTGIATDVAGNSASTTVSGINIDKTPPQITINTPANGSAYILNQTLIVDWSAIDILSGIASATGTLTSGTTIDTGVPGTKTFTVIAADNAGNTVTQTASYTITYNFLGILPPIKIDGSSSFKLGRTVPVKFRIADANGNYVSTAIANLTYQFITAEIPSTVEEAVSTSAASEGNTFRYDSIDNLYIFNLATEGMNTGTYQLNVNLDDGTVHSVRISLK